MESKQRYELFGEIDELSRGLMALRNAIQNPLNCYTKRQRDIMQSILMWNSKIITKKIENWTYETSSVLDSPSEEVRASRQRIIERNNRGIEILEKAVASMEEKLYELIVE